jgi:serine phosphatase RsbU (regulator of sigma subunit)
MRDSIQYASRIQRSLLPDPKLMEESSSEYFCLWEPRDIDGGDMYWVRQDRRGYFVALFDCTGHGVPGALMTTIAVSALNIAFAETADPARLISRVNQIVKHMLGQEIDGGLSDDGLEMGVCHVEPERMRMTYSGAKFELLSMNGKDTEIIKGDKSGLGYRHVDYDRKFTNHSIRVRPGQKFYMYTDGITDQIGGNRRRAFGRKRLVSLLGDITSVPLRGQEAAITQAFANYQGAEARRDDVSMIGFMPIR